MKKLQKLQARRQAVLQGTDSRGSDRDRRLVKRSETDRVFLEPHLTAGGHKGRDATLGKVKKNTIGQIFTKIKEN